MNTIGENAGKIWGYVSSKGPMEAARMRFELKMTNADFFLALGWLARENKITLGRGTSSWTVSINKDAG